ncbi:MAG: hypothetical protein ACK5P8_00475 [Phycisphaerae bacterium]
MRLGQQGRNDIKRVSKKTGKQMTPDYRGNGGVMGYFPQSETGMIPRRSGSEVAEPSDGNTNDADENDDAHTTRREQ